ncbi:MAG: hypothetical protein ACQEQF_09560 [Bacillota bacterium]
MKRYFQKVIYFALVYELVYLFFHNFHVFTKGELIFKLTLDIWVFIGILVTVIYSFFYVGIIKIISFNLCQFIYNSDKFIIYLASLSSSFEMFALLFFSLWREKIHSGYFLGYILMICYFIILLLCLYYFWKYRLEVIGGFFIINTISYETNLVLLKKEDFLDRLLSDYLTFGNFNNFFKGLILLTMLSLVVGIAIFLRKKGVYDYRSRQEKWRAKMKQGYYARYKD